MSGSRGTFHLDSKTGVLEEATADLPPTFHIVADTIEKIGEATYRIRHGVFTACEMPDPAWSFTLSEATVTLDDYARMKDVAFQAREGPALLHAVPDLADEGGPRHGHARPGHRLQQSARRIPRAVLLLGDGAADGRDDAARRLHRRLDRRGNRVALAADRRVGGPLPGLRHPRPGRHGLRSALAGPARRRQRRLHAAGRPDRRLHGGARDPLEAPPRPRRRRPAVRVPGSPLDPRLFGPAVPPGLRAQLRPELRAADRLARFPVEELRLGLAEHPLRAKRDVLLLDRHPGALSDGRVLSPHGADRRQPASTCRCCRRSPGCTSTAVATSPTARMAGSTSTRSSRFRSRASPGSR